MTLQDSAGSEALWQRASELRDQQQETADEIAAVVRQLYSKGASLRRIADRLGRSHDWVWRKIKEGQKDA